MKSSTDKSLFNPFEGLDSRLKKRSVRLPDNEQKRPPSPPKPKQTPKDDRQLFREAMCDVQPIRHNRQLPAAPEPPSCPPQPLFDEDSEVIRQLKELVSSGKGFRVADTPEYIEGTGYPMPPEIITQLHRGHFSVQAHLDLHGLGVADARQAFDRFLDEAIQKSYNAVLIVHGRGLSSPAEPVLKSKVEKWINKAPWRKWLVAYTSARLCDGGAGATYVLLRQQPLPKRFRKSHKRP
jgi:DNA-nicking Smr family endonuclease